MVKTSMNYLKKKLSAQVKSNFDIKNELLKFDSYLTNYSFFHLLRGANAPPTTPLVNKEEE